MSEETRKERGARKAKIFWNGGSQAVRLPKEFRFEEDEVYVHREGDSVVLEPIPKRDWPDGYWERLDRLRSGLDELVDIPPLGGTLLDVEDVEER